jgi:D,D-heptose 1,7-bisphosphate phosphatase
MKAIFLDRDGTVNKDSGYISNPADFELYSFAAEAINRLHKLGYLVFVVTNQSGIARGFYTIEDLEAIHTKMNRLLAAENAYLDDIFSSPYHEEGHVKPFDKKHEDRKPGLGMFKKALSKYPISIKQSCMVGDRYTDIEFGKKAKLTTILVLTGDGEKEFYENFKNWEYKPDFVVENLLSAVDVIETLEKQCEK